MKKKKTEEIKEEKSNEDKISIVKEGTDAIKAGTEMEINGKAEKEIELIEDVIIEEPKVEEIVSAAEGAPGSWKSRRGRGGYRDGGWRKREEKIWIPKTRLGKEVKEGKIKDIDEIFDRGIPILEAEIVDTLLPELQTDLIEIGQSKGKFGGGKRRAWRQTQRKTAEGNVPSFSCMTVVGDCKGHIGIGSGKARETLPAREKAMRNAKINLIRIKRGCGSFDCGCKEEHSLPLRVEGKCGSSKITLLPAPKGTRLVIEKECKKMLSLAGIKDIYSKTFGQTRTKFNLLKACFEALSKTTQLKH